LYLFTSLMGRTRYTNLWVPEGHTHISEYMLDAAVEILQLLILLHTC
jgi:hypothetical protein